MNNSLSDNSKSRRILYRILRRTITKLITTVQPVLPQRIYMTLFTSLLRSYGMQIYGNPIYISPTCWFDGTDYSLITIGNKVVISSNVSVLTHDFSLARIRDALTNSTISPEIAVVREVKIGENSFIGRGVILMPGTVIGSNCLIGAGSVVRGNIPDGSIVLGNPAQVIGNALEWGEKKLQEMGIHT